MESSRRRWVGRILWAAFGLFLAAMSLGRAFDSTSDPLTALGNVLTAIGWVGLFGSLAVGFRSWTTTLHPLTAGTGVPNGWRGLRLARRQIDGPEPYDEEELPHLRELAERRVSLSRPRTGLAGLISSTVLVAGFALAPPDYPFSLGPLSASVLQWGFRVLCAGLVVVCISQLVTALRTRTDAKAEAFLARTA